MEKKKLNGKEKTVPVLIGIQKRSPINSSKT